MSKKIIVARVAKLVEDEVGFDVTLINTKCNQIVHSDATCGLDFWKSLRKVLADQSRFTRSSEKKKAYSAATDLTQDEDDCDAKDEAEGTGPPLSKR